MKNILFVASECVPFIKTGGLADVVGSLPKNIDKKHFDVRVILPNYSAIPWEFRGQFKYVNHFYMEMGRRFDSVYVGIMEYNYDGITYYFVDNEFYFNSEKPYGSPRWDVEKFTYFSKAVLAILPVIGFRPDVIHCHDWQTGLVPVFLKTLYAGNEFYSRTKSIMTIHNLKYQGVWNIDTFKYLTGLPADMFSPDKLEFKKDASMLKGGLVYADYITTVSQTYANEIQTEYYGEGLNGLLSARHMDLRGIINGIDYNCYNPATEINIGYKYNADNFRDYKYKVKADLQRELGLPVDSGKFVIGLISRLTDQKGLDLIRCVIEQITDDNTQFVILGTGDDRYENMFKHYQWIKPMQVSANIYFSEALAHRIYAGSDAMLMPSMFEPCGLTQLISMRYGSVPIVRETGGLKDTVEPFNKFENTGTGFSFTNYNAHEMLNIINFAKDIFFNHREQWNNIVERGMKKDFSWKNSAGQYMGMYDWLIG